MDTRRVIPKLEFYITNVCNLTCQGCNRFNDLPFKGHQLWKDYEETIFRWAEKIRVDQVVIMGGEPLLNPSIREWITGLKKAWGGYIQIMSNGTQLHNVPGLYETLLETESWLGISVHDATQREKTYEDIRHFLKGGIVLDTDKVPDDYVTDDEKSHYQDNLYSERIFRDKNWVKAEVWNYSKFTPNAVRWTPQGRLTLHQNRPEDAFGICAFQHHKNYHFIKGKIYRCGPVALFPELDDQYNLDLSPEDKQLIRSYQPLSINDYEQRADDFFQHIDDMIPQCKFCSADDTYHELVFHDRKKKKVNTNG